MSNRVKANRASGDDILNKNIGIFVVDYTPINIKTLLNLTPFFIDTAATGNVPCSRPAAAEPKIIDNVCGFHNV